MAKNKLLGNIASLGIVQIANYAIPMITVPIISRIIGPKNYGTISYMFSFVNYFVLLISFGFDMSATRVIARNPHDIHLRNRIFGKVFQSQIILFVFSSIVFSVVLFTVKNIHQDFKVAVFTYLTTIGTLFTQNWLFQAMQDLKKIAIFNFISRVVGNFSVLFFVTKRDNYYLQPLVVSCTSILVSLLSFFWALKKFHIKILFYPIPEILKFISNEKTIFFNKVAISLYTITNTFMLGFMVNKIDLGYYSAATTLITIVYTVINTPLSLALYPYIGNEFGKSVKEGSEKVKKFVPVIFYATAICSIGVFVLGSLVIHLFYGKEYSGAIKLIRVMAIYPLVVAFADMFKNQILLNLGYDKIALKVSIVGGILSPLLNYILITFLGAIGAAINWIFIEILLCFLAYYYVRKLNIMELSIGNFSIKMFFKYIKNRR